MKKRIYTAPQMEEMAIKAMGVIMDGTLYDPHHPVVTPRSRGYID